MISPSQGIALLGGSFLLLLLLRVPVAFALGLAAFAFFLAAGVPMAVVAQKIAGTLTDPILLAIPFFVLCGDVMGTGSMARRLVDVAAILVGRVRGGLALVNIVASFLFGGISGSSVADTASLGRLLIPEMVRKGYERELAVAVTVSSSTQGIVVPPSHNAILVALAAGGTISIRALFLAGYLPGLLIAGALMVLALAVARRRGYPREPGLPAGAALRVCLTAIPALSTPLIIIVPIALGWIPAHQAGVVAVVWAALASSLLYRDLPLRRYPEVLRRTTRTSAMVLILIGTAAAFGEALTLLHVPRRLAELLIALPLGTVGALLVLNLLILLLGTVMDMAPLIVILTPILLPVAESLGMHPVQFGIVLLINLGIGLCTPPVGATLFVGCAVGDVTMERATKALLPFYAAMVVVLLLVTFWPDVSLAVPRWLGVL